MTIEIRAQALALAQQRYAAGPDEEILALAGKYVAFIGGVDATPAPSKAGRKAKGEVDGVATKAATTQTAEPASAAQTEKAAVSPATTVAVGTKEAMKAAVLAYRDATDQATALKLLSDVGAENFGAVKPELYQQVTDAAVAALAATVKPVVKEVDPFGDDDVPAAAPALVLADIKKAFVARQKDVSESALLDVLKRLGAVGAGAPGQPLTPSLKFLTADKFAAAVAAVNALPKTK
jgi:hypothetical protein